MPNVERHGARGCTLGYLEEWRVETNLVPASVARVAEEHPVLFVVGLLIRCRGLSRARTERTHILLSGVALFAPLAVDAAPGVQLGLPERDTRVGPVQAGRVARAAALVAGDHVLGVSDAVAELVAAAERARELRRSGREEDLAVLGDPSRRRRPRALVGGCERGRRRWRRRRRRREDRVAQ